MAEALAKQHELPSAAAGEISYSPDKVLSAALLFGQHHLHSLILGVLMIVLMHLCREVLIM